MFMLSDNLNIKTDTLVASKCLTTYSIFVHVEPTFSEHRYIYYISLNRDFGPIDKKKMEQVFITLVYLKRN